MKLLNLFTGTILTWIIAIASMFSNVNSIVVAVFALVAFSVTVLYVVEVIKDINAKSNNTLE